MHEPEVTPESESELIGRPHVTPSSPVHVVAGLLRREDRVLLCHRREDRSHYPNVWDLPGGRVEPGETLVDALTRELEEELGIVPIFSERTPWLTLADADLRLHIYLVDDWTGEPSNLAPEEHDEIRWTRSEEIGDLTLADSSYPEMLERALGPD